MMMGSLNNSQISAQHGPGTSGGQASSSAGLGALSKKKYSLNSGQHIPDNASVNTHQPSLLNDSISGGHPG